MKSLPKNLIFERFEYCNGKLLCRTKNPKNQLVKIGQEVGYLHKTGYRFTEINGKSYGVHRLIWVLNHGDWPKGEIDHINGVRDDNRIENLRDVSRSENCLNRHKSVGSCDLIGVSFEPSRRGPKYRASLKIKGQKTYAGLFYTAEEAAAARNELAQRSGIVFKRN